MTPPLTPFMLGAMTTAFASAFRMLRMAGM